KARSARPAQAAQDMPVTSNVRSVVVAAMMQAPVWNTLYESPQRADVKGRLSREAAGRLDPQGRAVAHGTAQAA
ncbi:MAG: hypothetical protein ACJAQU_000913, partial [Loktanella salsilacus]